MKIFKAEKDAGIAQLIKSNSSIAYVTQLEPIDRNTSIATKVLRSTATNEHPIETLYPLKDILVSTGINLNLDVFDTSETYIAKNTPVNHPFNLQHDEKKIIGHIVSSQAVDNDYNPLADDLSIEELPEKFHIMNSSVLYRVWQDEEQQELMDRTIAEIEKGEWYVSMECIFKGFDFGVIGENGTTRVIARNEESAFLTKHLRQYGGTGSYKDEKSGLEFKLGRVLRNITFSGKGLVRRPANLESIIINNVSAFVSTFANLEYIKAEEENISIQPESTDMSDTNTDVKKLEDKVAELQKQNEGLVARLQEKEGESVKAEVAGLKADIVTRDNKITTLEAQVTELTNTVSEVNKRVEAAETAKKTIDDELTKMKAEKVEAERLSLLTGKGATSEKAAELVKKFSNFSDEQFNALVETLSAGWKPADTEPTTQKTPQQVIDEVAAAEKTKKDVALAASTDGTEEEKSAQRIAKAAAIFGKTLRFTKNNKDSE